MQTRNPWWTVFASFMGLLGSGSVTVFVFSVFIGPLSQTFGWTRGAIGFGLLLSSLGGAIASPFVGWLVDRIGIRGVVLPAIVAFALLTAAFSLLNGSLPLYFALLFVLGIAGALQSPLPYSKLIAATFDNMRGLALGIAITGTGVGAVIMPQIAGRLVAQSGWRVAFIGLGIAIFIVAFPATALLLPKMRSAGARAADELLEMGTAFREGIATRRFWQLAVALLLVVVPANGIITHAVTLLGDLNVPPAAAVGVLSASGLVTIVSRLAAGFALDRFNGPLVAATFVAITGIGALLLAVHPNLGADMVGIALCGVVIGAEMDVVAYLVSRYFGLRAFGRLYGLLFAIIPLGVGLGSALMGATYDRTHSYGPALTGATIALFIAAALFATLGSYRFPARRAPQPLAPASAGLTV